MNTIVPSDHRLITRLLEGFWSDVFERFDSEPDINGKDSRAAALNPSKPASCSYTKPASRTCSRSIASMSRTTEEMRVDFCSRTFARANRSRMDVPLWALRSDRCNATWRATSFPRTGLKTWMPHRSPINFVQCAKGIFLLTMQKPFKGRPPGPWAARQGTPAQRARPRPLEPTAKFRQDPPRSFVRTHREVSSEPTAKFRQNPPRSCLNQFTVVYSAN